MPELNKYNEAFLFRSEIATDSVYSMVILLSRDGMLSTEGSTAPLLFIYLLQENLNHRIGKKFTSSQASKCILHLYILILLK